MDQHGRWKIWYEVGCPVIYEEFFRACESRGVLPPSIGNFAKQVGKLLVARINYTDRSDEDALKAMAADEASSIIRALKVIHGTNITPSGEHQCCGGGKVV